VYTHRKADMSGATVAEPMKGHRPIKVSIGAGVASGLLLAAAAPAGLSGSLAWICLAPAGAVALAWRGTRAGRLAVPIAYGLYLEVLLIRALPFGIADGQWGDPPPVMIGDSPVLFVALLAIPAFAALLYAIRFGEPWGLDRLAPRLRPVAAVGIPASAFAALDFVRVSIDPGGFWGPLFLSQYDTAPLALSVLGGPWLVSFALAASGYALAQLALALAAARGSSAGQKPIGRAVAVALGTAALVAVGVAAGLSVERGGDRSVVVAALQPGYDTAEEDRWQTRHFEPGGYDGAALDLIHDLSPMTREAAAGGAELVVWPEAAVWVDPAAGEVGRELRRLASENGTAIVVPYFLRELRQGQTTVVLPDGTFTATQAKQRPMWFLGENGDNRAAPQPVSVTDVRTGTMLGVDNQGPRVARALAGERAELLVSATHDWEELAGPQRAFAAINAAATGTPLVRADWRYGSAIYGPDGERIAGAGNGLERTVLVASVPLNSGSTPFTAIGDALGWLFLALSCAAGAVGLTGGYRWSHEPRVAPR
jgi:apolipoprotein N-acyltransferase